MLDEPTDHLDMESITALNNGIIKFPGVVIFSSLPTTSLSRQPPTESSRFLPNGSMIDKITTYDEYLASDEMARKRQVYAMSDDDAADN